MAFRKLLHQIHQNLKFITSFSRYFFPHCNPYKHDKFLITVLQNTTIIVVVVIVAVNVAVIVVVVEVMVSTVLVAAKCQISPILQSPQPATAGSLLMVSPLKQRAAIKKCRT